jgi:hypothetical protein
MTLWIPDKRFEAPELFIPGQKPLGKNYQIDWSHPLASGLDFYVCPGYGKGGFYRELSRHNWQISDNSVATGVNWQPAIFGDPITASTLVYDGVGNTFDTGCNVSGITIFTHFGINNDDYNLNCSLISSYRSGFGPWRMTRTGNESYLQEVNFNMVLDDGGGSVSYFVEEDTTKITTDYAPHAAVGRWIPGYGIDLWIDGRHINFTATPAGYVMVGRQHPIHLVGADRYSTATGNHAIYSAGVITHAISDADAASLSRDPYQWWAPV